jgi:cell shape-determining protein MreD
VKRLFIVFLVLISLILEISFFPVVRIFGIIPNVFLMLILAFLFILPEKYTFYSAFWGSLILGLFSNLFLGSEALVIISLLLILILSHNYIFTSINYLLLALFSVFVTLFYDLLILIFYKISGYNPDFIYFLKNGFLAQILVNAILVIIFYSIVNHFWDSLIKKEERSRLLR